jgi:putative oxygen-independent coproporphyrinogen III oxidase
LRAGAGTGSVRIAAPSRRGVSAAQHFAAPPPLGLYVHIPWCMRKCPYCDFNSHEVRDGIDESAYTAALVTDLEQDLTLVWGRPVETVFIGGGTPNLFAPETIDHLLSCLRARLPLTPGAEITMEANPGAIDHVRFAEFRDAGINRISLGIQSLDDRLLERIGRIHDAAAARAAAASIRDAGFDNWNIDLMFGLPGQTIDQALSDLAAAIALGPPHLSHYQLTIEPNTAFWHRPPPLPDDDALWDMQLRCQSLLAAHGLEQYEVSAYALPGHRCRHNLNYWRFGDYLGIGAGAHAKLTSAPEGRIRRVSKVRNPRDYLERAAGPERIDGERVLSAADTGLEFMMNALRLNDGFSPRLFAEHAGLALALFEQPLARAGKLGLLERSHDRVRTSAHGRRYLDNLLALFLPDA